MEQQLKESQQSYKALLFLEKDEELRRLGAFRSHVEVSLEQMDQIIKKLQKDYKIHQSFHRKNLGIEETGGDTFDFDFYFCINGRFIKPRSYFEEK